MDATYTNKNGHTVQIKSEQVEVSLVPFNPGTMITDPFETKTEYSFIEICAPTKTPGRLLPPNDMRVWKFIRNTRSFDLDFIEKVLSANGFVAVT